MQLLISVKNCEEALLAASAEVDVIDLKDPNIGAVGALSLRETEKILQVLDGRALVSATVGVGHATLTELVGDIQKRADLGVDIVKIAVSPLFDEADFYSEMQTLTKQNIKLVALLFADVTLDAQLLAKLKMASFYGAMLDTQDKHISLVDLKPKYFLNEFVRDCEQNNLISGLAGSLKPQDVEILQEISPTFIGFRGGVCENNMRKSALSLKKICNIKKMLPKHNKMKGLAQKSLGLTLHSALSLGIVQG